MRTLVVLLCAALLLGACGDKKKDAEEGKSVAALGADTACSSTTTATGSTDIPASVPPGLRPASDETVTRVGTTSTATEIEVTTTATVEQVFQRYKTGAGDAGFTVSKTDDEGREAEVYFTGTGGKQGSVLIARTNCPPGATRFKLTVPA